MLDGSLPGKEPVANSPFRAGTSRSFESDYAPGYGGRGGEGSSWKSGAPPYCQRPSDFRGIRGKQEPTRDRIFRPAGLSFETRVCLGKRGAAASCRGVYEYGVYKELVRAAHDFIGGWTEHGCDNTIAGAAANGSAAGFRSERRSNGGFPAREKTAIAAKFYD